MSSTATEVNERQMEAMHKMYLAMDRANPRGDRTIVGVSYFREFVDQMKKEKEVDALYSDGYQIEDLK